MTGIKKSPVKIAFGRNRSGRIVSVADVPKGNACGVWCCGCGAALQARKGEQRQKHFAHFQSATLRRCQMSAIHAMAQQLIIDRKSMSLPEQVYTSQLLNGEQFVKKSHILEYESAASEVGISGFRADIQLFSRAIAADIFCEIIVTHRDSVAKSEFYQSGSAMVLAIDLSHLRATVPSVDELEHEIFNGHNTRWIHNPFFTAEFSEWEKARIRTQTSLPIRIAEVRWRRWDRPSSSYIYELDEFTKTNANPVRTIYHSTALLARNSGSLLAVHPNAPDTWMPIEEIYTTFCVSRTPNRHFIDVKLGPLKHLSTVSLDHLQMANDVPAKPRLKPLLWDPTMKSSTEGLNRRAPRDSTGTLIFKDKSGKRW